MSKNAKLKLDNF